MDYLPFALRRAAASSNRRASRLSSGSSGGIGDSDGGSGGGSGGGGGGRSVRVPVWQVLARLLSRPLPAAVVSALVTTALLLLTLRLEPAPWRGAHGPTLPWFATFTVRGGGVAPPPLSGAWSRGGPTAEAAAAAGTPSKRLAAAAARLATGVPPPAQLNGGCGAAGEEQAEAAMAEAADGGGRRHPVGFIDTLGVGCCTRLRTGTGRRSDGAGGKGGREGGVPSPQCFHESLTTTPGPVEVARRVNVTSPPDADTIFSVVVPYKGYLYTPMGRGLGIERTYWPDGWALRWNASAAVALEALGAVLHEERVAAAAAALPAAAAPPAALASLAIRQTHHRLSADGGDLWVFDIDAAAVPTPHPALATRVAAAAARAAGKSPPLMVPHIHSGPMSTLKPTRLAWNVVVARPLVGDDTRHGHECTVATLPRPVATPLTLIVPYATRDSRLTAFLATYRVLRYSDPALSLLISTLPTEVAEVNRMVAAAALPLLPPEEAAMDTVPGPRSHHTNGVTVLSSGGDRDGTFSRSVAIRDAVASLSHDVLFFVTDVDLTVGPVAVHNCRANALAGGQAWFPIFWNYYAATPPGLSPSTGFWRTSSYGPVCAHRSSWDAVGGFGGNEEERFAGWGSEDVVAYQHFRDHPAMGVMRGLEPGLTHTWHAKTCARNAAHAACVRTLAMSMASQERLASLVLAQGMDVAAILGVKRERGGGMR